LFESRPSPPSTHELPLLATMKRRWLPPCHARTGPVRSFAMV
jgi:hypothetical protein